MACAKNGFSASLATGTGRVLGTIDARLMSDALVLAHRYARSQPKIVVDFGASRCVAISFKIGAEAELIELEVKLGTFGGTSVRELAEFANDGVTRVPRHARELRLARIPEGVRLPSAIVGSLTIATAGFASLPSVMPPSDLSEPWRAYIADLPRAQATRDREAREADALWLQGRHPSQQPDPNAKRLLENFKLTHNGSMLTLDAGFVVEDPQLIGSLESAGAILGTLDEIPKARGLAPGTLRFLAPHSVARGPGGLQQYREGQIVDGVSQHFVDELRRDGASVDFGGPVIEQYAEFFPPKPPRGRRGAAA